MLKVLFCLTGRDCTVNEKKVASSIFEFFPLHLENIVFASTVRACGYKRNEKQHGNPYGYYPLWYSILDWHSILPRYKSYFAQVLAGYSPLFDYRKKCSEGKYKILVVESEHTPLLKHTPAYYATLTIIDWTEISRCEYHDEINHSLEHQKAKNKGILYKQLLVLDQCDRRSLNGKM